MEAEATQIIERLQLVPHPEGGYFKETYRSKESIKLSDGKERNYATAIYFLLTADTFSAFHKISYDEIWHFYAGSTIELHIINEQGAYQKHLIGNGPEKGEYYQQVVPAHHWFAARVVDGAYGLVGCTVAPGFDFEEFTLGKRDDLLHKFPRHKDLILEFTR